MAEFITSSAVREVDCPRCGQTKGNWCRTPSGKAYNTAHGERVQAYRNTISHEEFMRRHSIRSRTVQEMIDQMKQGVRK